MPARSGEGQLPDREPEEAQARLPLVALVGAIVLVGFVVLGAIISLSSAPTRRAAAVTLLTQDDFTHGTFIIDRPGTYRLVEDISFNPNSPATLDAAITSGTLPAPVAESLGLSAPVDAYGAGFPLFTQFATGATDSFSPGGATDPLYDPSAYGIGFFAAIAISADDVVLDLDGHTIEQSAEHALLQRFFAVIETANQPFTPGQGPHDFGAGLDPAHNLVIKNGTIGRSSHHGVHGNGNVDVTIHSVDFVDYEVAAVALNGVRRLRIRDVNATNRKDVPVLGTFSSAQFMKPYVDELVTTGSTTTLRVGGEALTAADVQADLRAAINNTHADVMKDGVIDRQRHPTEYGLFHNRHGVVDGNSYSFLLNSLGVAVDGFPLRPDGVGRTPSIGVEFENVHVTDQVAAVNEIVGLDLGREAGMDAVGALLQIWNRHPDTGALLTVSTEDRTNARYTGNAVANAQALVTKAALNGDFADSRLDVSRANLGFRVLSWVEGEAGSATLADIGAHYLCNGDSMFHVNKGAIGFKLDGAVNVKVENSGVSGLVNLGEAGSDLCGDYSHGRSHPAATLQGYGGAAVRGFSFAGTDDALVRRAYATDLDSTHGSAIGFDVMTDSNEIRVIDSAVERVDAGTGGPVAAPTADPRAVGFSVGADTAVVRVVRPCVSELDGAASHEVDDRSGDAEVRGRCG